MVLGGEDHVLHAGLFGSAGPLLGVKVHGVKLVEEGHVVLLGHLLHAAHPLAPGGDGVQPPVDEHAKAGVGIPGHALVILLAVELVHTKAPLLAAFCRLFFYKLTIAQRRPDEK